MEVLKINNIDEIQKIKDAEDIELIQYLFNASAMMLGNYKVMRKGIEDKNRLNEYIFAQINTKNKMKSIISELNKREEWRI